MRAVLVLVFLVLVGCSDDERQVGQSVRQYNEALIVAFRTGDLSPLQPVAHDEEIRKVEKLLDLKREGGLVLESTLVSFEVLSAKANGNDGFVVETKEQWRYFDRELRPGKSPARRFVADMHMRYEVKRSGNEWRVLKVRTIANQFVVPGQQPDRPPNRQAGGKA